MKHLFSCLVIVLAVSSLLSGCTTYPDSGSVDIKSRDVRIRVEFTDEDRRLIHDYYRKRLPPGLAKKEKLPPGLEKHLKKNGSLPAGLEKRALPSELERRLSWLPVGYVRVKIGNDIILMNEATQVISDILYEAGF